MSIQLFYTWYPIATIINDKKTLSLDSIPIFMLKLEVFVNVTGDDIAANALSIEIDFDI